MCGIVGIISNNIDKESLKKASLAIKHRGPDDAGFYVDRDIGLAHRRLSIIDLSKNARQPMSNENGNIWIVYNGEIYNFKELRNILEKNRHRFKSNSDTEVIVHAYEEWGEKCVEKFNGMFAFAIWDSKKKTLFLARDRTGIKPLYYYFDKNKFLFASETKSLFEFGIEKKLNEKIIYDYLNYFIFIGEETLFKNIYSFPPGNYAVIKNNKMFIKNFWEPDYKEKGCSIETASKQLKGILEESVKSQLVSDVPVGAFFSGGLDSSTIVALAKKYYNKSLKTFTAGFDVYPEEIENAEWASNELGTEQYNVEINSDMFIKKLPKLIWNYDHPLSFASSVPLYFVSELAKNKVKVVLTGEGSDELFAGYRRYHLIQKAININKNFSFLLKNKITDNIINNNIKDPRYIKILKLASKGINYDYLTGINCIIGKEREEILKIPQTDILNKKVKEIFEKQKTDFTNKLLYLDLKTYLVELLMKQDRMSMAASIESRVPFLDNKVIDFANSLPSNFKLNGKVGKFILRRTTKEILPKAIINRKKIGFTVPLDNWFKGELNGYIKEELNNPIIDKFFNKVYITQLVEKQRKHNCSLQLWALLNFKIWYEQSFKNE